MVYLAIHWVDFPWRTGNVITRWYIPDPISSQQYSWTSHCQNLSQVSFRHCGILWSTGHRLRDRQLPQSDPAGALSQAQWGASGTIRSSPVVPLRKNGAMKTSKVFNDLACFSASKPSYLNYIYIILYLYNIICMRIYIYICEYISYKDGYTL